MYDIDFLPQIEEFGTYLFGSLDPRNLPAHFIFGYIPSKDLEILECVEAPNGEWVPKTYKLEELILNS